MHNSREVPRNSATSPLIANILEPNPRNLDENSLNSGENDANSGANSLIIEYTPSMHMQPHDHCDD